MYRIKGKAKVWNDVVEMMQKQDNFNHPVFEHISPEDGKITSVSLRKIVEKCNESIHTKAMSQSIGIVLQCIYSSKNWKKRATLGLTGTKCGVIKPVYLFGADLVEIDLSLQGMLSVQAAHTSFNKATLVCQEDIILDAPYISCSSIETEGNICIVNGILSCSNLKAKHIRFEGPTCGMSSVSLVAENIEYTGFSTAGLGIYQLHEDREMVS